MANVLVLKSSINGETSLTNQLINEFLAARQAAGHDDRLIEHDLSAMALPTLDRPLFAALRGAVDPQPAIRKAVALSDQLIAELKASDLLVIGAPMYNLNVPTDLKKWFDLVARARETFRYTESWPQGLVEGVRAVVVSSRGGIHPLQHTAGQEQPRSLSNHQHGAADDTQPQPEGGHPHPAKLVRQAAAGDHEAAAEQRAETDGQS